MTKIAKTKMTNNLGERHILTPESEDAGIRLDVFISAQIEELSRSKAADLIDKGSILVNDGIKKSNYRVKPSDRITVTVPVLQTVSLEPENIPLDIIYEDECMAVINKPKGMVVHPAAGAYSGTLVNALMYYFNSLSTVSGEERPGIVHRLDKDTSGLLVIAKNDRAHLNLKEQIADRSALRIYRAVLDGNVRNDSGSIIAPIGRSYKDRKKMAVVKGGRYAHTDYAVLERFGHKTYMEFSLNTGRTHQIRVHAKHIGHPVTGDATYGGDLSLNDDGQLLHAYKLVINHPLSGERMEFVAPLPKSFQSALRKLRKTNI